MNSHRLSSPLRKPFLGLVTFPHFESSKSSLQGAMGAFTYQTLLSSFKLHTSPPWQPLGDTLTTGCNIVVSMSAKHSLPYPPKKRNSLSTISPLSTFLSHHSAQSAHPTILVTNYPSTPHFLEKYAPYKAGSLMPFMKFTLKSTGFNSHPLGKPGFSLAVVSAMAFVGGHQPSNRVCTLTTGNFKHVALFVLGTP